MGSVGSGFVRLMMMMMMVMNLGQVLVGCVLGAG